MYWSSISSGVGVTQNDARRRPGLVLVGAVSERDVVFPALSRLLHPGLARLPLPSFACGTGDRYAGEFPRELFRKHGIAYELAKQTKSELFRDLLPLLNSGRIVLPRNDRLQGQIVGLERRTSAVGRDTISHPDRGHDDVANAVAGAAALSKFGGYDSSLRWVSGDDDSGDAWQRLRLQAYINSGGRIRL